MIENSTKKSKNYIKILEAASEVFRKYGYAKTTIEDIAKEVSKKKSSIYYYFKSKDEIFIKTIEAEIFDRISEVRKEVAKLDNTKDKIACFLKTKIKNTKCFIEKHDLSVDIMIDSFCDAMDLKKRIHKMEKDYFAELLNEAVKNEKLKKEDVDSIILFVFATFEGLVNCLFHKEREIQVDDENIEKIVSYVIRGINI